MYLWTYLLFYTYKYMYTYMFTYIHIHWYIYKCIYIYPYTYIVNTPDGSRTLIGAVQGDVFYKEIDGPQRKNSFFTKNGGYDNGPYGSGKDRGVYC
jgi:hypothetical protein